ncbi:MAG: CBS domain-containing protein, partial [Thermoleophilia bacterium]|nr:CBS domain-containing protein [Thermoleophilia bacterium]
ASSTLLRQADVAIVLPGAEEACGTGNVPTTSTTMTLALGDAMAVALMEHRQFTPDHFRAFHPGGRLGARLARVSDLMHGGEELPLVPEAAPMGEVLLTITRKGFGVAGVCDPAGRLSGIITDGDLRRHMEGLLGHRAAEVMTGGPRTVPPDMLAGKALAVMNDRKITCLFVVDPDGYPQGILHIHDLLRAGVA